MFCRSAAAGGLPLKLELGQCFYRLRGEYVGLKEIDDGIWNVYFGPLKLDRFHERHMRIKDEYGRLKRQKV